MQSCTVTAGGVCYIPAHAVLAHLFMAPRRIRPGMLNLFKPKAHERWRSGAEACGLIASSNTSSGISGVDRDASSSRGGGTDSASTIGACGVSLEYLRRLLTHSRALGITGEATKTAQFVADIVVPLTSKANRWGGN